MLSSEKYKDLSIKEFTKAATKYEGNNAGVYKICRYDYPEIIEEIEKEPFDTLLDAGCGPATVLSLIADKYPDKKFIGIDLTPKMIEVAKSKKLKNVTFILGDCENLPFEKNSFDIIVCSQSFHHYPSPQKFFNSVYKCLKPNGKLILRDMGIKNTLIRWFVSKIELPILNIIGFGDVSIYSQKEVLNFCINANLKLEKFEYRKFFRMHCIIRK